jgi:YesN/AraC family two-component response regulator
MGAAELARAMERQGLLAKQPGRGKTILVVDDQPEILEMHIRVLQAQSNVHKILRATNGLEALKIVHSELPDLILLDLMMPELDGFGVLEALRQEEATSKIPVIVLTAQVLTEENMEQLNQGVAAVLGKGLFSAQETLAHIETTLARKKKLGNEIQRLVRKALAHIHAHYAEALSRDELADYIGVSNDYLTRCFRQEMGVTPVVYLNRYRVNRAKDLLLSGDHSITDVATAVGFSDSSYFSQVFRREVGVSPNAYRRALIAGKPQN